MNVQSEQNVIHARMKQFYPDNEPGAALIVIKDGKLIIEEGYGLADLKTNTPITSATNFRLASVSKQFTALGILILAERRRLFLNDTLDDFFSDIPKSIRKVTIRQLLTHTSGIWDYESLIPKEQQIQISDQDVLQLIRQKDSVYFIPGSQFRYSNTGYCLLALVVEKVSGDTFNQFTKDHIFTPLEMSRTSEFQEDAEIPYRAYGYHLDKEEWHFADKGITSSTLGDGGVYCSLTDYKKWDEALSGSQLFFSGILKNIFTPHVNIRDGVAYGLGWFVAKETDGTPCMFHSGESTGFHNIVYRNPTKGLLIVIFTNRDDDAIAKAFDFIVRTIGVHMAVKPSATEKISLFHWLSNVYDG